MRSAGIAYFLILIHGETTDLRVSFVYHNNVYNIAPLASASTINAILMRRHEFTEGIEVVDADGSVVGTSTIAAKKVRGPIRELLCSSNYRNVLN